MPLNVISRYELHCLYDKIFNPFQDVENNFNPHVHDKFESLRTECNYYALTTTGTRPSNEYMDKLLILHLNVRSILNTAKFESLITFLHFTGIHWDIVCISETWLNCEVDKFRNIEGYTAFLKVV